MSSLFQRKGVWYLVYNKNGKRTWKTTKIKVKLDPLGKIAKQVQREFDTREAKEIAGILDKRFTVVDGFKLFLASKIIFGKKWIGSLGNIVDAWKKFLSEKNITWVNQIEPCHLQEWISKRQSEKAAPRTIQIDLQVIRGMARHVNGLGAKINYLSWPRIKRTPTPRPETIGAYSLQDVEALLYNFQRSTWMKRWYFPTMILAFTGCRFGELIQLKASDFHDGLIRIESRKTADDTKNQIRYLEIHPRIKNEFLPTIIDLPPGEAIFPNLSHRQLTTNLIRHCKKLKIQYRRVHGLRHFFITQLIRLGAPLPVVQKMAGHDDIKTTMRYCHMVDGDAGGWVGKIK